jgi:hypothetical protein
VSRRRATLLAWSLWGLFIGLIVVGKVFQYLSHVPGQTHGSDYVLLVGFVLFPTVGAVIASRRPDNAIGWLYIGIGLTGFGSFAGGEYAIYAFHVHSHGGPPAAFAMEIVGNALWTPTLGMLATFALLVFPTGHLPSRRWRPVAWLAVGAISVISLAFLFTPGPLDTGLPDNPLGIRGAEQILNVITSIGGFALIVSCGLCVASIVVRFRRARGDERQQLKWFVYAAVVLLSAVVFGIVFNSKYGSDYVFAVGVGVIPVAAGIAILKYRLYDIDRIVNRTLVYGAVTILLGAVYAGLAVGLGSAVGSNANSLVIAGSTLVVAALFRPARRRIQAFIDRRFYRRKYDAVRTLEVFTARLRDEVDLGDLEAHLLDVVRDSMQPAQASLWLRTGEAGR